MTMRKYPCPHHEEKTPSAVAYPHGYYSFCCGRSGPLSELGLREGEAPSITYVEDLVSTIEMIKRLPAKEIRGFNLHYNEKGYYLVWPTEDYYKLRINGAESGNKYRGPSGHRKPPLVLSSEGTKLVLVEGEFNAMSLYSLKPKDTAVISPGGAGDFYSRGNQEYLKKYARYPQITLVVDSDAAGVQAAIEAKSSLVVFGCSNVRICLVEKDFNDIHIQEGLEVLRDKVKRMEL